MNKKILSLSILLSLSANANYSVLVNQQHHKYDIKESYDEITYGEWLETSRSCEYNLLEEDVYFGQTFTQEEICDVEQERNVHTKTIYPDGSFTEKDETEYRTIEETTSSNNKIGTHLENTCLDALNFDNTLTDDIYTLNISGSQTEMYCDMTTDGGGWMLVSHIYDKDDRDDILNNSNGAGWGDLANNPTSDTSFNLDRNLTPEFTEAEFEWIYPLFGDQYRHDAMYMDLAKDRFAWVNPNPSVIYRPWHMVTHLKIENREGYITGVFGIHPAHPEEFGFLDEDHMCGGSNKNAHRSMHYWGFGSQINYGNDSTYELHSLSNNNTDRATGTSYNAGCGTRNSILNIWIR